MPYPNFHAARVRTPDSFQNIVVLKTLPNGIMIYGGRLKSDPGGSSKSQAYRFPKSRFSVEQAKKWLADHNIKPILFEAAKEVQSFMKNVFLECFSLSITPDEIMQHIPDNVYSEIKEKNPHPYFQAYSIIQNGTSKPKDLKDNSYKPIEWGKDVLMKMKGIIKKGLQFFIGHNKDNSTNNRKSIGEVITDFQKKIGDKLHHIVVGYFPDKVEAQKYDVCSIEANILTEEYPNMSIAKKIEDITGIALGNSQKEKPAFDGAVRLGTVQAFGDNAGDDLLKDDPKPSNLNKGKEITMTFEEIKSAVKSMNIFPNQLFTVDEIKDDREFGKVFDKVDDFTTKEKDFQKQIEDKDEEIKTLKRSISESGAHLRLENVLSTFETDDKKLTDLQKNFINKKFDPKNLEELTDEKITEFVNGALKEYPEYASIFGENKENGNGSDGNKDDTNNDDSGNEQKDDVDQVVEDVLK
jgi:hypothetical protein